MTALLEVTALNCDDYLPSIVEIENSSFPSPWSPNAFVQELKNSVSRLWVAVKGMEVAGYLCFWMFDSEIQVVNFAVHPGRRGQGHGTYLLSRMIENALSKGVYYIWLEVRLSNQAARGLYGKLGFEKVGMRPGYYRDTNEDAMVMGLRLNGTPRDALAG